jgi:excisionase family DNA binding protein
MGKYKLPHEMTLKELAAYLRVPRSTVVKALRRGQLRGVDIGIDWTGHVIHRLPLVGWLRIGRTEH